MPDTTYVYGDPVCAPNIGLDQQRIDILSKQGRDRIAAENAAKEAAKAKKLEDKLNAGGQGVAKGKKKGLLGFLEGLRRGKGKEEDVVR